MNSGASITVFRAAASKDSLEEGEGFANFPAEYFSKGTTSKKSIWQLAVQWQRSPATDNVLN